MKQLQVKTHQGEYPIYIGDGCLNELTPFIQKATQVVVITDETVYEKHQKVSRCIMRFKRF